MAKLTEDIVKEIKLKFKKGFSSREISECLNVSHYSVKDIKRNKTWKHVEI